MRLYGTTQVIHKLDTEWPTLSELFPAHPGARQFFVLNINPVQASCGFSVPLFNYIEDRSVLDKWVSRQKNGKMETYWRENNQTSIDGYPTHIVAKGIDEHKI